MANSLFSTKNKGLYTLANPLNGNDVPEGSFAAVKNIVVDRNDIVEPRRGYTQYGNPFGVAADRAKQILSYKDTVLRHVLSTLQYDVNANFVSFTGPAINEIDPGLRIKSIEANGNLYFVSETGIKKISARNASDFSSISITEAGGVKALDLFAAPNYSNAGFLLANSKVAYRVVWGTRDLNDNLILGYPSSRAVVNNISLTDSCIVDLKFSIPASITSTNYFYQIYRTGISSGDITPTPQEPADPGDEMYLVFEDTLTPADLIAGSVSVQDITPEDFRRNGALLYTNPTSGEGIEQANEIPPFAKDIALYKNYTFYANTKTKQRLQLAVLSVRDMVSNVSTFVVSNGVTTNTYTFQGSVETYTVDATGAVITDFYNAVSGTARYFTLDSANDERSYYIWFKQSAFDLDPLITGKLGIQVNILSTDTVSQALDKAEIAVLAANNDFNFAGSGTVIRTIVCSNNGFVTTAPTENFITPNFVISKDGLGTGEDAAANKIFLPRVPTGTENGPTPSQQLEQVARSIISVINQQDTIVYGYYISGYNDIPGQMNFEQQAITGPAFYLSSNVGQEFNPTLPTSGTSVSSANEISPNRIYFSKIQQPEAVPLPNYIDIGPKDREIKRIIALRDSLFIFKEDGIYRLSGQTSDAFVVAPFDFSSQVLAADTAVVLNNQIYTFSTQGVIVVTDTGVSVISRPIENLLLKLIKQSPSYKTASFGVSYESDRSYLLYVPSEPGDKVATQCYRYNTFTSCWTNWSVTNTCGIVNFADDIMYVGAGDINFVEKERKTLTRMDHADREYILQILLDGVVGNVIEVNSVSQVETGDVVIQKQYLTGEQFNRMLDKLDRDIGIADHDYVSTLTYSAGQDMRSSIFNLAAKMDADPSIVYSNFSNDIADYTEPVTSILVTGSQTKITTTGPNSILNTRYINVAGTVYGVVASDGTSVTINAVLTSIPVSIQTAINDFRDMQACFNIMVNVINLDNGPFFTNYPLSIGSVEFEMPIISFNKSLNTITVKVGQLYLFGDITLYKAIATQLIYNPIFFGDASMTKQISEGTMIFENSNFSKVSISYATDLSPAYESITFQGAGLGIGDFGYFNFGTINFGGIAAPIPLRTLIPLNKQRCRFINVKFDHKVAFEKYAIYGISLVYRGISSRGYR